MSDEEYGCLDDDDLLHFEAVAVQAEQGPGNKTRRPGSPPPTKKQRLNTSHDRGNSLIASRESVMQKNVSGHRDAFSAMQPGGARQNYVQRSNGILNPINPPSLQARSICGHRPVPSSDDIQKQLDDLPSDAFESSSPAFVNNSQNLIALSSGNAPDGLRRSNSGAPQGGLRQTTLFNSQPRSNRRPAQPIVEKNEPPTHHKLDEEALATWVYPTNLGTIRDYQYSIVYKGLFHNTLVALPTGLGKTFIAAVIMLNFFRWTKESQIIFVAPTKPLVSQQVDACFQIAGIPRSETTLLTGDTPPALRAEEWKEKRVFFMTPQTIMNDLKRGYADPKRIVLLVVDEAHRATGAYAYVELVKFIRRFNESFRVLALTATPGSDVESVQKVINGLDISKVEIRTEQSIDIRQYVHSRRVDKEVFKNSEEMILCMDLFSKAIQPVLNKLNGQNVLFSRDPLSLSPYGCQMARQRWMSSDGGRNASFGLKNMVNTILNVLASLAHSLDLLKFHGVRPFFHGLKHFRAGGPDIKNSKHRKEILDNDNFKKLMGTLEIWNSRPDFIGHPKLEYLQSVVLNHFLDAGDGQEGRPDSKTRIMVFAHFRDSAEDIVRILNQSQPMVRSHVFVGQAASKNSEGMDQKRQLEIVKKFKEGKYNTLVATSIGEEGLDIGEVDLIICYDSKASPIRMLQRMGRTGRKRAGKIVLLQMEGKEENDANKAKDNYEKMQELIASGARFEFHDARSRRIVPKGIIPQVDKRVIEIPIENSQAELPEPKKRGRKPKLPPKKFYMPDGAITGFTKASRLHGDEPDLDDFELEPMELEPIPTHDEVLLGQLEAQALETRFQTISKDEDDVVLPRLNAYPELQRTLRKTGSVKHGALTTALVETVRRIRSIDEYDEIELEANLHLSDLESSDDQNTPTPSPGFTPAPAAPSVLPPGSEAESDSELEMMPPPKRVTTTTKPRVKAKANSGVKAPVLDKHKRQARRRDAPETALADEAPPSSSPPPVSSNMRIASQAVSLGDSDTPGEDDDEEEPSSELAAFVAGDSESLIAGSSVFGSSSFPLSPAVSRKDSQRKTQTILAMSDSNGDSNSDSNSDDSIDEDIWGRNVDRGQKEGFEKQQVSRKRRVVDSDDDDDDDE